MLEPESDQLFARLEAAEDKLSTLSDLQDQISELQAKIDAEDEDTLVPPMVDVKACADALNALVIGLHLCPCRCIIRLITTRRNEDITRGD